MVPRVEELSEHVIVMKTAACVALAAIFLSLATAQDDLVTDQDHQHDHEHEHEGKKYP